MQVSPRDPEDSERTVNHVWNHSPPPRFLIISKHFRNKTLWSTTALKWDCRALFVSFSLPSSWHGGCNPGFKAILTSVCAPVWGALWLLKLAPASWHLWAGSILCSRSGAHPCEGEAAPLSLANVRLPYLPFLAPSCQSGSQPSSSLGTSLVSQ